MRLTTLSMIFLGWLTLPAAAQTYVVKPGDSLQKIAIEFYGHQSYDKLIAKHNNLGSTKAPIEGKSILVPELNELLIREGMDQDVQFDVNQILKARYTYMVHRSELLKALPPAHQGIAKTNGVVPLKIKTDLLNAARDIDLAAKNIAQKGNFLDAPVRMRRELQTIAANLRKMAAGKYKKEYDESVHKNLANMFLYGITWARDEDGNYHKLAH